MKALLAVLCVIAAAAGAAEPQIILPRNLLIVGDIEASKRFYTALGFQVTRDAPIADQITFKHLGIPDRHTARIVVLQPSPALYGVARDSAVVALLQVGNPPLPKLTRPAGLAVGETVMALRTDDIETVITRLQELGADFAVPPVRTPDGLIEMAVLDPDGRRMQINQRPDSEREKAAQQKK
jgi:catechol 2,3-dioxygenase-like lactoylglutathione lyase family enzyme